MARKPRSDSRLKTQPPDVQEKIYALCEQHGLERAVSHCAQLEPPVATNRSSLSEFCHWWDTKQQMDVAFALADAQSELMKEFRPGDAKLAREFGEFVLLQLANKRQDKDLFTAATMAADMRRGLEIKEAQVAQKERQIAQKGEELSIAREKFKRDTCELFLKWSADERARQIVNSTGTNAEKIEQLGLAMFGEDWK